MMTRMIGTWRKKNVSLEQNKSKPSFYDVSLVDGYNSPISVPTKPTDSNCVINGCTKSVNSLCPKEHQVLDQSGVVVACKSACLVYADDSSRCRNLYESPENSQANKYSKIFKNACPSYVSYAFDSPSSLVQCSSKDYVITLCPSRWSALEDIRRDIKERCHSSNNKEHQTWDRCKEIDSPP